MTWSNQQKTWMQQKKESGESQNNNAAVNVEVEK